MNRLEQRLAKLEPNDSARRVVVISAGMNLPEPDIDRFAKAQGIGAGDLLVKLVSFYHPEQAPSLRYAKPI